MILALQPIELIGSYTKGNFRQWSKVQVPQHISFHLFFVLFIPNTTTLQTNGYIWKQPVMDEQTLKSHIGIHWLGVNKMSHLEPILMQVPFC